MRRYHVILGTAVIAMAMGMSAYADDIVVRTSVGSGEVLFTETAEPAEISEEDLTDMVKGAINNIGSTNLTGLVDISAKGELAMDEQNKMPLMLDVIGNIDKFEDKFHAQLHCAYEGMGQSDNADYESYMWKDGDKTVSGMQLDGQWYVSESNAVEDTLDMFGANEAADEAKKLTLSNIQPNLYEENGVKYYACVYNYEDLKAVASEFAEAEEYFDTVDKIVGDNNIQVTILINTATGMPRAFTINAGEPTGTLSGDLLESDTDLTYNFNTLYATLLVDDTIASLDIPEEVLNAPSIESAYDYGEESTEIYYGDDEADFDADFDADVDVDADADDDFDIEIETEE